MNKFELGQTDRTAYLTYRLLKYAQHSQRIFHAMKDGQPDMIEGAAEVWFEEVIRMADEVLDEVAQLHILGDEGTKAFRGGRAKELATKIRSYRGWLEKKDEEMIHEAAEELKSGLGL